MSIKSMAEFDPPQLFKPEKSNYLAIAAALFLFGCSSLKHMLFRTNAMDLGIFDQAIYLISQGENPLTTFLGFHILGDHAAFILYPLALLYKIHASVYWLLAVQAIALAFGTIPTTLLALQAGLNHKKSLLLGIIYLLYPIVFNNALTDFHPETLTIAAFLWAVYLARYMGRSSDLEDSLQKWQCILFFTLTIAFILACKAVLALTVVMMGIWLILFEQSRICGAIALFMGVVWFIFANQYVLPTFGGELAIVGRHLGRYEHLGKSFAEILSNLFLQPQLILKQLFSLSSLEYIALLGAPMIYCLRFRQWRNSLKCFLPLFPAIPVLTLNLLAIGAAQRDLVGHYSVPVMPFLMLVIIACFANGYLWWQRDRYILLWAILAFLILARLGFFFGNYWQSWDTWEATNQAITIVRDKDTPSAKDRRSLLTTMEIAPHLTHRPITMLAIPEPGFGELNRFDLVLLNVSHPGWLSNPEFAQQLMERLKSSAKFNLTFARDQVYLFERNSR